MKPTVLPVAALLLAAVLSSGQPLVAAESKPAPAAATPRPYPDRLQWWAEARFGMFIHWGPVSLKGTEISWSRANTNPKCPNHGAIPADVYDNLYKDFNPTKFDAAQWVGIAKAAGAKYIVLTAKHCDGFLLWHSQASDYNIAAHAVPTGHLRRTGQGGAGAGHQDRLVFLADGLARSRLPHRAQRGVPRPDAGGTARVAEQLRPD